MTWDLNQLETLLADHKDLVITREENCLLIANTDGIDAWLAISGEQILVESLLFAKSEVKDHAALNEEILKTHMIFPLTTGCSLTATSVNLHRPVRQIRTKDCLIGSGLPINHKRRIRLKP